MSSQINIVLKATDEASKVVADASNKMKASMGEVEATAKKVRVSAKDLVTGFSGVATSAFSLYNAYDRVQDMQLQVDRANLKVKSSANSVEDAQRQQTKAGEDLEAAQEELAQALENYSADSEEVAKAQDKVNQKLAVYQAKSEDAKLASERYDLAVQNAKQTQDNFNQAIVQSAIQIVPTAITLVDNIGKVTKAFSDVDGLHEWVGKTASKLGGLNNIDFSVLIGNLNSIASVLGTIMPWLVAIATPQGQKETQAVLSSLQKSFAAQAEQPWWTWIPFMGYIFPPEETAPFTVTPYREPQRTGAPVGGGPLGPSMWGSEGGIFTKPTIIGVGEVGPEAVIPLNRGGYLGAEHITINATINIDSASIEADYKKIEEAVEQGILDALPRRMRR